MLDEGEPRRASRTHRGRAATNSLNRRQRRKRRMLCVSSPSLPSSLFKRRARPRVSSSLNRRTQRQQRVGRAATILSVSSVPSCSNLRAARRNREKPDSAECKPCRTTKNAKTQRREGKSCEPSPFRVFFVSLCLRVFVVNQQSKGESCTLYHWPRRTQ